tara:strand:- start:6964 stop:7275 length:312 start_codon:yes stop_codon:yes gene_type:complete
LSYKALPDALHIGDSQVAGQGIFAKEDIPVDTELGLSHILLEILFKETFRTPLGGFINHSDDPNCVKYPVDNKYYTKYYIKTIRPIKAGEELFLKYTFYSVHK